MTAKTPHVNSDSATDVLPADSGDVLVLGLPYDSTIGDVRKRLNELSDCGVMNADLLEELGLAKGTTAGEALRESLCREAEDAGGNYSDIDRVIDLLLQNGPTLPRST